SQAHASSWRPACAYLTRCDRAPQAKLCALIFASPAPLREVVLYSASISRWRRWRRKEIEFGRLYNERIMTKMILPDNTKTHALAAKIITAGGVVAFRTDTFYGLGADPFNHAALQTLKALKGREEGKPILV